MDFDWRNRYDWLGCLPLLYCLDYWNTLWVRVIFCKNKSSLFVIIFMFWKERFNINIFWEHRRGLKMFNETDWLRRVVLTVSCEMPFLLIDETMTAFGFWGLGRIVFSKKRVGLFRFGWSSVFLVWVSVFLEMRFFLGQTSAIFITFTFDGYMRFFTGTFECLVVFHHIFENFFLFTEFLQTIYYQLIDFP